MHSCYLDTALLSCGSSPGHSSRKAQVREEKRPAAHAMSFFHTQGTLKAGTPSYVERPADHRLLQGLLAGDFCYVLTSRQMGKSSLMVHTAERLHHSGVTVIKLDLSAIGVQVTPDQWYDGLVVEIGRQLGLSDPLENFWFDNERIGLVQRLFTALRDIVLPNLAPLPPNSTALAKLVIFVDEIDVVRSLRFPSDEFFAAIRECSNSRNPTDPSRNIAFALLGVATPAMLLRDPNVTPFNIGHRIELTDFTSEEAFGLTRGLGRPEPEARALMTRILRWTNGHPYLTHRLCEALAGDPLLERPNDVDRLCEDLFLSRRACERDPNLLFVRESLVRQGHDRVGLLQLYEQIHTRKNIPDDEADPLNNSLRLSGVVRVERGLLVVRNRIYQQVFDRDWIEETLKAFGAPDTKSIAVLPFVDLSVEPNEYLADGVTDELIIALGQVPSLRVSSRNSVFEFKGKPEDIRHIGEKLGVTNILEGSVRRLGQLVRVTANLVSVADGKQSWSVSSKYDANDVHLIRDEIVRHVVDQFRPSGSSSASPTSVVSTKAPDRQAYQLYLKGRFYLNRRNEASVSRSAAFFEEAIALDPDYAAAHAGLGEAFIILGVYNYRPPVEILPRAREAAFRALEIDNNLAEAHAAAGCVWSVYDWDWVKAEKAFRRAIALNPSYATAHHWHAINCLTPLGRHEESLAALRLAQEVDPLCIRVAASIGLALHLAGRNDEAIAHCRYTLELDETFWLTHMFLGCAYLQKGDFHHGIESLQSAVDLSQGDAGALASLGHAFALQGRHAEATRILEGLIHLSRSRYVPASEIATVYAGLRQMDLARQWMDRAHKERSFRLIYLRVDPRFTEFRGDT